MNKTFNSNLGGFPFSIDEDAYDYVRRYLASIRQHFSASEGCEEILYDIEVRMAELFQEHLGARQIVGMKEVDEVIAIMGKPEDFGAEPIVDTASSFSRQRGGTGRMHTGKRLFRNPEDKKIGGVCSGIAAYFGIEDPLWMRLLFIALIFTGFGVFTYIILWILMPEASSTADKLAMRGEPATIENIAKAVEEEFNELGERINDWSSDLGKKKSDGTASIGVKGFLSNLVNFVGQLARAIIPVIVLLIKIFAGFISAVLVLALLGIIVGLSAAVTVAIPFIGAFTPDDSFHTFLILASIFILVAIPIIFLILFALRIIFSFKPAKITFGILGIAWLISIVATSFMAASSAKEFSSKTSSSTTSIHYVAAPEIVIHVPDEDHEAETVINGIHFGDEIIREGDFWYIRDVSFQVMPSQDSLIHIEKTISSRGKNRESAQKYIDEISHEISVNGNEVTFSPYVKIPADSKFRNQSVDYIIKIPTSKNILYKGDARDILNENTY